MPAIIGWIWAGLAAVVPTLVGRVLLALGLTLVTMEGLDVIINQMEDRVFQYLNDTGAIVYGILWYLGVGAVIKMHIAVMMAIVGTKLATKTFKAVSK